MNKKRLFSIVIAVVLVFAISITAFAISKTDYLNDGIGLFDNLQENEGYLTVFDQNAVLKSTVQGQNRYEVDNMEILITSENIDFDAKKYIVGGEVILDLFPSAYDDTRTAYATVDSYRNNVRITADNKTSNFVKYSGNLQDRTADNIFSFRYGFEGFVDNTDYDAAGNRTITQGAKFEQLVAQPGDKFKVVARDWIRPNNKSSFALMNAETATVGSPFMTSTTYQEGYIYIPFAVNYNTSGATGTAPAAEANVWEETPFTVKEATGLSMNEAAFVGWTLDSAAQNKVYAKAEKLPEIIAAGEEFTFESSLFEGTNPTLTAGNQTLYAVWGEDKPGTPPGPDTFEANVTYTIENGTWDGTSDTIVATLNLVDETTGKPAQGAPNGNGKAVLGKSIPEVANVTATGDYTTEGLWMKTAKPEADTSITGDTEYIYTLLKVKYTDSFYGDFTPAQAYTINDIKSFVVGTTEIEDTEGNTYKVTDVTATPDNDGVYTVTCDRYNFGGPDPDKYFVSITYKVVNGTWNGTNPAADTVTYVFRKSGNNINGSVRLTDVDTKTGQTGKVYALADAAPATGYKAEGTWDEAPDASKAYSADTTFTLTLEDRKSVV